MDNDVQYFKAVIDTANLISVWLKSNPQDIMKILSSLEISLEAKYGPFTSKLSNQIGINETLGLKSPDSYWKGVQDTLSLIKNFLNWKQLTNSARSIDNFLVEIVNKSNIRLAPEESPLITALGILFDQEYTENSKKVDVSLASSQEQFIPEEKPVVQPINIEKEIDQLSSLHTELDSEPKSEPEPELQVNQPERSSDYDKAFDPDEFIDDEKFLDQFIADSITPETTQINEDLINSERDYLRSALEELSISQEEPEPEKEVNIQFQEPKPHELNPKTTKIIEDSFDEKDTSRLLSSSLRDALRMLREED